MCSLFLPVDGDERGTERYRRIVGCAKQSGRNRIVHMNGFFFSNQKMKRIISAKIVLMWKQKNIV